MISNFLNWLVHVLSMKLLLPIIALLLLSAVTFADSTQQYNKLYLNPFYKDSLANNVNSSFSVTVNPPDRIAEVKSAILNFNIYMTGQTTNYSIWMNGQECNTRNFYVSTTYATSGQVQVSFDCTNILNKAGIYSIILRPSGSNTGAVSGWLEMTYMNSPKGELNMHGTEYIAGDGGKMFLQFLDANRQAINNSACLISLWYPNNTAFVSGSAMSYLSDGIYFYNFNVPLSLGVYPATAKCYVPYQFSNITIPNSVVETWESNTFIGGTGWDNRTSGSYIGWDYYNALIYTNASAGTGGCQSGNYCAGVSGIAGSTEYLERGFISTQNVISINLTYWTKQQGFGSGDKMEIDVFDGVWHILDTYTNAEPANTWVLDSHIISVSDGYRLDNQALLFGVFAFSLVSPSKTFFIDNITMSFTYANTSISNATQYQVLFGSGEVHVNAAANISNITSLVWNYPNRTLTDYNQTEIYSLMVAVNSTVSGIQSAVNSIAGNVSQILTLSQQINSTVNDINAKNYTPTIIVNTTVNLTNVTNNFNNTQVFNYTQNVTVSPVFNVTTQNVTVQNVSVVMNNTNLTFDYQTQASYVWNSSIRALTDYNLTEMKSLLADTNNTVYMNKASLATALILLATINATTFQNFNLLTNINSTVYGMPSQLNQLIETTTQANSTANLIWAFLQNSTLNITVNATMIVNSTQIAQELAAFDVYEYYVTPTGNIPIATGSLFGGIAYAAPNGYSSQCLDSDTLQTTVVKVRCIDNDCRTIETNTTEQCNYGCDTTAYPPACLPSTSTSGMWFFALIIVLIVMMIFFVRWATKRV